LAKIIEGAAYTLLRVWRKMPIGMGVAALLDAKDGVEKWRKSCGIIIKEPEMHKWEHLEGVVIRTTALILTLTLLGLLRVILEHAR
jgi:hypothetical protein